MTNRKRDITINVRLNEAEQELIDRLLKDNPHLANTSELIRWLIAMVASMERNKK